jgi:hypothetical protein
MGQFSAEKPVLPGSVLSGNQHAEDVECVADALASGRITLPGGSSITKATNPFDRDGKVTATAIRVGPLTYTVEEAVKLGLVTSKQGFERHVYERLVAAIEDKCAGWQRWRYGIGEG